MGLLPLLHALTIYLLGKGGPLHINILKVLSAVYKDKVIMKKTVWSQTFVWHQLLSCYNHCLLVIVCIMTTIEICQVCADYAKSYTSGVDTG